MASTNHTYKNVSFTVDDQSGNKDYPYRFLIPSIRLKSMPGIIAPNRKGSATQVAKDAATAVTNAQAFIDTLGA